MNIVFNPPIGQIVHGGISLSVTGEVARPTTLVFTARLDSKDHEKLIEAGGRVQLWADISPDDRSSGGWHAFDFVEAAVDPKREANSDVVVSLASISPLPSSRQETVLYLMVDSPRGFQFTYRILYASGDIKWLGRYAKNGLSLLHDASLASVDGLDLRGGWSFRSSRRQHVFESNDIDSLEILRLKSLADVRVLALGEEGFLSNNRNARLLLIIPQTRHQHAYEVRPTYVVSSCRGLSMSVSSGGGVFASGAGSIWLSALYFQSDPVTFIQDHIQHCMLDAWNILSCNPTSSMTVLLTSSSSRYPSEAAVIPLWPSKLLLPVTIPISQLIRGSGTAGGFKEMALFSSQNLKLHLFDQDHVATTMADISLKFDIGDEQFKLSPVYQLLSPEGSSQRKMNWAVAVFSPNCVVRYPFGSGDPLPTPPPSSLLKPDDHLTWSRASMDTLASVDTLPSSTGVSVTSRKGKNGNEVKAHPVIAHSRSQRLIASHRLSATMLFFALIKTFFFTISALMALLSFFCCCWVLPLRLWHLRRHSARAGKERQRNPGQSRVNSDSGDPSGVKVSAENGGSEDFSGSTNRNNTIGKTAFAPAMGNTDASDGMTFIELHRDAEERDPTNFSTTATIALIVLDSTCGTEGLDHPARYNDSTPNPVSESTVANAVRFFTQSGNAAPKSSHPDYIVSRCESAVWGGEKRLGSCYLLDYQLDWEDDQTRKIVGILPSNLG